EMRGQTVRIGPVLLAVLAAALSLEAAGVSSRDAEQAARKAPGGVFSLLVDNDFFAATDRRYTNGIRIAWTSAELGRPEAPVKLPGWLEAASRALSFGRAAGGRRYLSIFLDQRIYTPEDITLTETPAGEHPYAGYTGIGLAFHSRDDDGMDTVEIDLGLVGPDSLAGEIQALWHRFFGFMAPSGWARQLKDEFVLGLAYDHRERVWASAAGRGIRTDGVARAGGSLSNALTAAGIGAGIRVGWNLPDDFGAAMIPAGPAGDPLLKNRRERSADRVRPAIYGYLTIEGQAVLRDIFLDGNTFRDGPHVEKYPFRGALTAGLALRFRSWSLAYGYVLGSRSFETEPRGHIYGTVRLSFFL
ncbi:MAG: lipid A deacylase LpxR family protein, partial [Candidatus Aminicenantes bacterium]|nr:lipid A deacylase LpxR family protein [Candidatus Aminicenantes bacterium]